MSLFLIRSLAYLVLIQQEVGIRGWQEHDVLSFYRAAINIEEVTGITRTDEQKREEREEHGEGGSNSLPVVVEELADMPLRERGKIFAGAMFLVALLLVSAGLLVGLFIAVVDYMERCEEDN